MSLYETYINTLGPGASAASKSIAKRFCNWLGDREPNRVNIKSWMDARKKKGYAAGSLAREWGVIRRICITSNVTWPFARYEGPQVSEGDERRPILSHEAVSAMIRSSPSLGPEIQAHLALATTYGLRRIELQELHPESFDWAGRTIYVATAKAGRQRYHLLPEEIVPVLQKCTWAYRSTVYLSTEFVRLRLLVGISAQEVGWHSIRRSLMRELSQSRSGVEGMSETERTIFGRWKGRAMASRYPSGVIIGLEGEGDQHVVGLEDQALDRRAFSLNPWLSVWKEQNDGTAQ